MPLSASNPSANWPIACVSAGRALVSSAFVAAAAGTHIIIYELTTSPSTSSSAARTSATASSSIIAGNAATFLPATTASSSSTAGSGLSTLSLTERKRIVCDTVIIHLAWSPMENALCATGADLALRRFDYRKAEDSWREVFCVPAHTQPINGCEFNADGSLIATCSDDGTVRIHESQSGRLLTVTDLLHPITRVLWHRGKDESNRFLVADTRGRIRIYAYGSGDSHAIMTLFTQEPLADVHWQLRDDSQIAAITDSKWLTFDTRLSSLPQTHGELESPGCAIAWSLRDPSVLAIGMADRMKIIRLTEDGNHDVLAEERGEATSISFHTSLNVCVAAMGAQLLLFTF
eukprot:m.122900 g.122900  ORF g.122900 m.122900 type:complete len:347 (-) comp15557_c0_seq2:1075-2115(-)